MLKGATIVFDLDGTLVDTAPDLTIALNHVLTNRGHAAVSPAATRQAAGRGARVMIEQALQISKAQDDVNQMVSEFIGHYEANIATMSRPFPGAAAALERLAGAGSTLAICTNKSERLARMLLQALKIDHYFAALAGRDTLGVSKPDPGHLTGVIALAGGKPSHALMIGDSAADIAAARGAGVPSILVSFGYAPPPPDGPHADAVIDHFDSLEERAYPLLKCLTDAARPPS